MADQVRQLQQQVDTLFTSLESLRQETARLAPLQDRVLPLPSAAAPAPSPSTSSSTQSRPALAFRVPSFFNGPTSSAFAVGVAKNTLKTMGYSGAGDASEDSGTLPDATPQASPMLAPVSSGAPLPQGQAPADPIWELDEPGMMRLLQIYREEVDAMYPVTSVHSVEEHIKYIAAWMDTARRTGTMQSPGSAEVIQDTKTLLLKIVLCCALVVDEHGNSDRAARLYDSIQPTVDKMLMTQPADVTKLPFLALCAGYRYLSNDEVLAWRMMGHVARLCFELGLHRREGLQNITDPALRRDALHTFWAAYILDRRWSFSTGLPFVCHDDKIDPRLPYPEGYPFLVAMIGHAKLGAKIWRLVDYFEPAIVRELKPRDFEELDREIMDWYESVPEEVRTGPLDVDKMPVPSGPYDIQRFRIWTRLRLNQVRIWLYTPVLHSAISILNNAPLAQRVVDLAKETIRLLARLNNETDFYRRIQVFYHQFLTSSIAVLFLASTHAPLQFSANCREEFYMALDLVKELSAKSWVSQRLWRTIRSLRAYAPRLGLEDNPGRTATSGTSPYAHAGSGNTGHSPGLSASFNGSDSAVSPSPAKGPAATAPTNASTVPTPGSTRPMQLDDSLSNGLRLQSEMSRIYEGYTCVTGAIGAGSTTGSNSIPGPAAAAHLDYDELELSIGGCGGGHGFSRQGDGSVYEHMKGMF
ncbi:uncharacterized protein P884DRAFT_207288 [Thermothelomyces heterothallicus CBS 202.75]|uniref:uncharacterized protein n=1 Tax=Thermothelomyces heterothallicus CBS 202.75 TaxID=1149848 RepID=UPI003742783D